MRATVCIALFLAALMRPARTRAGETLSEQQVVREVLATAKAKTACFRLANAHALLATNQENRGLLLRILELGNAKLSVGKAAQADVLAMDTDIQKLGVERASLEQALSERQTALNVLRRRWRSRLRHIPARRSRAASGSSIRSSPTNRAR